MKKPARKPGIELNHPVVIGARLVFLVLGMNILLAVWLLLTGGLAHNTLRMIMAAGPALGAAGLYDWLRRRGRLADVFGSMNLFGDEAVPDNGFTGLVHAWEDLRVKRGTAGFDAWELLRLRREIEAKAKDDPQLAAYWHDHQV